MEEAEAGRMQLSLVSPLLRQNEREKVPENL